MLKLPFGIVKKYIHIVNRTLGKTLFEDFLLVIFRLIFLVNHLIINSICFDVK